MRERSKNVMETYHVTFGAGKASHVIARVVFCPSKTFVSVND
jgi:hypothetical protein